ncbi:DUF134 domain-containing protein [Coraliomargarita sp. SDUM461003]|uniref:DUF134 domain-containing protein n=1 Tax=Thalassobacterium maritimum TaxID=3041265 RepID=A0ABU1AYV5_9BACT|nr:DUF134 domain-containing protein [Coraliomargarita sp. SDUM461003]MDQ8209344.1 DUF134 domain-containing protein [Coraliomargarita sp. SDUM461003]
MSRPRKARTLESLPAPVIYIPAGWTQHQSAPVEVAIEDFEIMRLTDGHNLNIEDAAKKVGVSRSTAGRMLERARRAIALGLEQRAPIYLDASEDLILTPPEHLVESHNAEPSSQPHCGGLAIACEHPHSDSPVERIFGRAHGFAMIHPDGSLRAHIQNPGAKLKRDAAPAAVRLLKSQGVSRVVAGRFGPEAIKALAAEAIQPLVANGFSLKQAIELFNR